MMNCGKIRLEFLPVFDSFINTSSDDCDESVMQAAPLLLSGAHCLQQLWTLAVQ
jgi:hypothetical protein